MAMTSSLVSPALSAVDANRAPSFGLCLNTSTIREQKLSIVDEVRLAADAGYQAIEPWMRELDAYANAGGSLRDLGQRIADAGLTVESAIGFAEWIVDDDTKRAAGLEQAKRDMDTLKQIGGKRLAAPPVGATKQVGLDLDRAAERYRALCELGEQMKVVPQVEVWGHSTTLGRLSESTYVAVASGHPNACLLPDVYHLYRGGSDFDSLRLLSGAAIHVFHVNDYPSSPPRQELTDAHRVYPGDGAAPWKLILKSLAESGFRGYLSLELFNREYWSQDAALVVRTGAEKLRGLLAENGVA